MILVFMACRTTIPEVVDLVERLDPGVVRAGQVVDPDALMGGVSADGAVGDFKIYNDRVQFIVQANRDGDFYVSQGGGVIDADLVRDPGVPGRDMIDEMVTMVGFGRLLEPSHIEVINNGNDGEEARIRVTGSLGPLALMEAAVQSDDLIPDRDAVVRQDYILEPDSWWLQIETLITWQDKDTTIQIGDFGWMSQDVGEAYRPGRGLSGTDPDTSDWAAHVGKHNEAVVALMANGEPLHKSPFQLPLVGEALTSFGASREAKDGDAILASRFLAVGPDLATLSSAWYAEQGVNVTDVGGTVEANGTPVAGARVHLTDGDDPLTVAFTDSSGEWSTTVPNDAEINATATGRGDGITVDLPTGAGWVSPYAASNDAALDSLENGAPAVPFAEGFGVSASQPATENTGLDLVAPAQLTVESDGPALVRVDFVEAEEPANEQLVPDRPSGALALGFLREDSITLPIEPGTWQISVVRGVRHEVHTETLTLQSGDAVTVSAPLAPAYSLDGVLIMDPHSHGSPSTDGGLPMSERLLVTAAHGIDVHFGTDHDHIADYRPLIAPLGLEDRLVSIVGDEVSPVGQHFNVYPLEAVPSAPNNGAFRWWLDWLDTPAQFERIRGMGEDPLVQVNHGLDQGMFSHADYHDGVADPERFSLDFEVMEVLNAGEWQDLFPLYLDLVSRGHVPAPVGVSDVHRYDDGDVGTSVTFVYTGGTLDSLTNDQLRKALRDRATVVSSGPYIHAQIDGVWAAGREVEGPVTVDVSVMAPSWMPVDNITLWANGEAIKSVADQATAFVLEPEVDTVFVITASGDTAVQVGYPGLIPWAMTAPILVDADGDGWQAPNAFGGSVVD